MDRDAEPAKNRIQEVPMLRCDAHLGLELIFAPQKFADHRGKFDGLGTCAEDNKDVNTFMDHDGFLSGSRG
jgi:hypothetical protein